MWNSKWLLVGIATFIFILSDSLSASWGKSGNLIALIAVCFLAPFGYFFFGLLSKNNTLSVASGLVNVMIVIGTILIGIFYFNDDITYRQKIGLVFAVLSVFLMN